MSLRGRVYGRLCDPQWRVIPFAFLSSTVWSESARRTALALGAVKCIMRPIAALALLEAVQDCLGQQAGGRSASAPQDRRQKVEE